MVCDVQKITMSTTNGVRNQLHRARYLVVAAITTYAVALGGVFAITSQKSILHYNAYSGGGGTPTSSSSSSSGGFFSNLLSTIQNDVTNGISTIVNTIFGQFNTITKDLLGSVDSAITQFLNLIIAIPKGLINTIQALTGGVAKTIGQIFSFGVTGAVTFHSVLIGGAQVPYLAILFSSVLLVGIGLSIIQFGDQLAGVIPVAFIGVGFMTTIGQIFIILGSAFVVYGSFPSHANIIFGLAFGLIGLVALLQVVGVVRQGGGTSGSSSGA